MSMCQRGGLLGAVASTWRKIDTSWSWTKNSTHFSLAWLSLGAPVLLLLYMVEGSFSAVIPGTPDQDQRLESHQNATSGSAGLRGWLDGGTGAKGGWRGGLHKLILEDANTYSSSHKPRESLLGS